MEHQDRIITTQTFKESFSVNTNFENLSVPIQELLSKFVQLTR